MTADKEKARSWLRKAVRNEKDGDEIKKKIKKDAEEGDEDAKQILLLLK